MTQPQAQAEVTHEAHVTVRNISAVLLLRIAQYPFLVLSMLLIPRMMGPHAYGDYALIQSILVMAASVTELGLGEICGRFVPDFDLLGDRRPLQRFAGGFLATKLALTAVLSGPLFLFLWTIYGDRFPATYFILVIATLFVLAVGAVPYGLMFGLNRLNLFAMRIPLRRALTLILVLVLYHYFGLVGAIASIPLVEGILTAMNLVWGRQFIRLRDCRVDYAFLKPYLKFGFAFYLSTGVTTVWQKIGNPMIAYLTGDSREVALFDIPNQIFLITTAFLLVTIGYLVPIFVRLLATGKEEKLVVWSSLILKYVFALSVLIVGGFVIAGRELMPVLIGREYSAIYPNTAVLVMGFFPMLVVQLGYVFCVVYKQARIYLYALICAVIVFVPAAFVLIPRLASMGASLATVFSTVVAAVVLSVVFWSRVAPCLREGAPVVALGIVFVPFWFLRQGLVVDLVLGVIAGLIYIAALLLTRKLRIEEITEVLRAVRLRPKMAE